MNPFTAFLDQLQTSASHAVAEGMRAWWRAVRRINALEKGLQNLNDTELRKQSLDLRWRAKEQEPLRRLLPEAFAVVREAARRTVGMRHFDVQLLAGCALHAGCIAEMETGEGKTLMASLPAYLNALTGQGVHVITVNDYLAARDAGLLRPVFSALGMTVGCIQSAHSQDDRRPQYACDITYGTANQFAFDFLKDRLAGGQAASGNQKLGAILYGAANDETAPLQRNHHYAIVDEADSVLIDEARTPLIISAAAEEEDEEIVAAYRWAAGAAREFQEKRDYDYDRDKKQIELTPDGRWRVRSLGMPTGLAMDDIYDYVEQALLVRRDYHRDRQYVVVNDEIAIVDEFTGRILPGRKWREGLHQAIEAKEGVPVTAATTQAARTTIQTFFLMYEKLCGMTGTAASAAQEMRRVYKLRVVRIPTHHPSRRKRLSDCVFAQEEQKWAAVVADIRQRHERGQPVLIGTRSIDKSEHLSRLLETAGIRHAVLNAKHHEREAEIISHAGEKGSVTIATNMAGRGVDIKLDPGMAELGGLHVLGTERHDSARIDRQLIGRAARQGDPGTTQFFVSLEDELLQVFGPQRAQRLRAIGKWRARKDGRVDRYLRYFRRAQQKVERKHYQDRVQLLHHEKQRTEMQLRMGLDPYLNTVD